MEFVEQEEVFDTPAVFIEFLPVKWTNLGGGVQRAEATIRLHIVTPWNGSTREGNPLQRQSLERFDLLDRIDHHLFNIMGSNGRTTKGGDKPYSANFAVGRSLPVLIKMVYMSGGIAGLF